MKYLFYKNIIISLLLFIIVCSLIIQSNTFIENIENIENIEKNIIVSDMSSDSGFFSMFFYIKPFYIL